MKKFVLLAVLMICCLVVGCGVQQEIPTPPDPTNTPGIITDKQQTPDEVDDPEVEKNLPIEDPQPQAPQPQEIIGGIVLNNGRIFGCTGGEKLGTEEDLNTWNVAIADRSAIAKLLISTMDDERSLTPEEIVTVLDTLEGLTPSVMEKQPGNPATGSTPCNVAAFDANGNRLWCVSLNSDWMFVNVGNDAVSHLLSIDEVSYRAITDVH